MDYHLGTNPFSSATSADLDETALIAAAQRGDLEAFSTLALAHQPWLYATACHLLRDAAAAADATQEALIAAYRSLPAFCGGSLKGWLYRIVTRKCYDQLRDLRRRRSTSWDAWAETDAARWPSSDGLPEPAVERRELAHRLEAGLNNLPYPERQIVVMRAIHGLNYAQIAAATHRPVGTVKSKLSRARARLRVALGPIDSTVA